MSSLAEAKRQHPALDLGILLDYNRATRESPSITEDKTQELASSRSLLQPLVAQGANVSFYRTPNLSGWWRQWIARRQRWNELTALHHMKLYVFDDDVIISGANLSDTYFTNRQDRYVRIKSEPKVADYFVDLIKTVGVFSSQLKHDGQFTFHPRWRYDPTRFTHDNKFRQFAGQMVTDVNFRHLHEGHETADLAAADTVIFPLLQLNSLAIRDEVEFTKFLFKFTSPDAQLKIATGYFNLTRLYQNLLAHAEYRLSIVMASEEANGFWQARGALYYVPYVYTQYLRAFIRRLGERRSKDTSLYYYHRPEWSFHAKGIWLEKAASMLTVIGSSNYGYRSVYRDNEASIVLLTRDDKLRRAFKEEYDALVAHSRLVLDQKSDLPKVPLWVKCYAFVFKSYF